MKLLILVCAIISVQGTDYCDKTLCSGRPHIGCRNNGKFAESCARSSEIINIGPYKAKILGLHNEKRNKVASGAVKPFKPAGRMATMSWDDELAYLAELNLKTCKFAHDKCRNTDAFSYSGQNLAFWGGYPAITPEKAVENAIEGWFKEHKDATMNVIRKYRPGGGKVTGHFTVMVADRNTHVGCSIRKNINGKMTEFYVACNYATTNMIDFPIYKESRKPATFCKSGSNPQYKSLCAVSEAYDVNKWF